MSKKPDTAAALASILKAKRGEDHPAPLAADAAPAAVPELPPTPSPALPPVSPPAEAAKPQPARKPQGRVGKYRDPNYKQFTIWIQKTTRRKAGRALEDADTGMDFSDLVQDLVEQWLKANT